MKKNSEILYEIACKLSDDNSLIEHALSEKTVSSVLLEAPGDGAIDDSDVEKLRKAVETTIKAVDNNIKVASDSNLKSLADYFTSLKQPLQKANELVSKLDLSDSEGIGSKLKGLFGKKVDVPRAMQAVIDLQNKSNVAANTIGRALTLLVRNLEGKVSDDVKLSNLTQDRDGIDADQLKSGISKAFKASKPSGFMAKLGSFLGKAKLPNIPGADKIGDLPIDSLKDEILELTFGQLKGIGSAAEEAGKQAEEAAVPADSLKDITSADSEGSKSEEESGEGDSGDAPKNPEEESDPAEEIKKAASEASDGKMSPKAAIGKALDDWEASLSKSSRQQIQAKKRNQALRDAVYAGVDKGSKAVQSAVAKAVKSWRGEHEETLVKSKRFAKKNFDSLEQMIPQLAAQVLAQANESNQRKISKREISIFVKKKLDKQFFPSNVLFEKWQKNAGLLED